MVVAIEKKQQARAGVKFQGYKKAVFG